MIDFEFISIPGSPPRPICCVALEVKSSREIRLWGDALNEDPNFPRDSLIVSYYATAEASCFLELNWRLPPHVIDLFAEFRVLTNGETRSGGASLLDALSYFGLSHLDPDVKSHWRSRIISGPPFSREEALGIIEYCASDVYALNELLPRIALKLASRRLWLQHALLRGRYMNALACIEATGVPINTGLLRRFIHGWEPLKLAVAETIRAEFPIYIGSTLKHDLFAKWLESVGIPWPRTVTGRLSLSEDTFKQMTNAYPILAPVRELRDNLSKLRLTDLSIGHDGRNRAMMSAFRARTGRNQPSGTRFIFSPSVWLRSMIRPEVGRALAYIDFSSQEIGIAAALSGDGALIESYMSGDPYLSFAKQAGLAPEWATKQSHGSIRTLCKTLLLGTLYGMGVETLANRTDTSPAFANELLKKHRSTYHVFWDWIGRTIDVALLRGYIDTCFGWRLSVGPDIKHTSLLNHPMQSHGAEILRLSCCFLVEAGVSVCAPVHDAVLIEAAEEDIDRSVELSRHLMGKASRIILNGFEIRTDFQIIRHPDSFFDERGASLFERFQSLLPDSDQSHTCRLPP